MTPSKSNTTARKDIHNAQRTTHNEQRSTVKLSRRRVERGSASDCLLATYLFVVRCPLIVVRLHAFSRVDWNLQAILSWRERTLVRRVVVAVREVRPVEVQLVQAGRVPVDVEEPSGRVRLGAARQVA